MSSGGINDLADVYRSYIHSILAGDLARMADFVADGVVHNNIELGLEGYKTLLKRNIIDTRMNILIKRLIADQNHVAAVLVFTTSEQTQELVGHKLNGKVFSYMENVIYDFDDNGKIKEVHSVFEIDVIRAYASNWT